MRNPANYSSWNAFDKWGKINCICLFKGSLSNIIETSYGNISSWVMVCFVFFPGVRPDCSSNLETNAQNLCLVKKNHRRFKCLSCGTHAAWAKQNAGHKLAFFSALFAQVSWWTFPDCKIYLINTIKEWQENVEYLTAHWYINLAKKAH